VIPEAALTPRENGFGLNEDERITPAGPKPGQPGPEEAIGGVNARPPACPLVERELVPQGEDFHLHGEAGSEQVP